MVCKEKTPSRKPHNHLFRLLVMFTITLFLISFISGFEFDNIKEINKESATFDIYKDTISIRNSFLQIFPLGKVADIKMLSNDVSLINGEAVFQMDIYGEYDNPITSIGFEDEKGRNAISKVIDYKWYYYDDKPYNVQVQDYIESCISLTDELNGSKYDKCTWEYSKETHTETKTNNEWVEYTGGTFKEGTWKFKIIGHRKPNQAVDMIPTAFGVKLDEYVWWDTTFSNKAPITITENQNENFTDFTMNMTIPYQASMEAGFNDLRFTNAEETVELNYYVPQYTASTTAEVLVKIPRLNNSIGTIIYMYYGNPTAPSKSNATDAFLFYDNFTAGYSTQWNNFTTSSTLAINDATIGGNGYVWLNSTGATAVSNLVTKYNVTNDTGGTWKLDVVYNQTIVLAGYISEIASTRTKTTQEYGVNIDNSLAYIGNIPTWRTYPGSNDWANTNGFPGHDRRATLIRNTTGATGTLNAYSDGTFLGTQASAAPVHSGLSLSIRDNGNKGRFDYVQLQRWASNWPSYSIGAEESVGGSVTIHTSLLTPLSGLETINSSLVFSANHTIVDGNLTNVTLYVWKGGTLFGTNKSSYGGMYNVTNLSMSALTIGNYVWNFEACATNVTTHLCNMTATNRTFIIASYVQSGAGYSNSTYETKSETFTTNFTSLPNVLSITGNLWYAGTKYSGTVSNPSVNNYMISKTIDIPTIITNGNYTFLWSVDVTDETGTYQTNTTPIAQFVNNSYIANCNDRNINATTYTLNVSTFDAINPNPKINATMKTTFNYWLGGGTTIENYSWEDISETNSSFKFCIYPNSTQYYTDASFEFDGTLYSLNHHYYDDVNLNTTILEQKLYLINSTLSTLTQLRVVNSLQQGIPNQFINIQLYDVGTGQYNLVGMAKTNYNGEDIVYLNWFDSFYRFLVINEDLEVIYSTNPYKVGSTPQTFLISETTTFDYEKFGNIQYQLYFNNNTRNFVLIYNDPTNRITAGCLRVSKPTFNNQSTIYDSCSNSTSATLSYNVGVGVNGTYVATFYAKGSFASIASLIVTLVDTINDIYSKIGNLDGTLLTIIIISVCGFVGIFAGPIVFALLSMGGYFLSVAMGLQPITVYNSTGFIAFVCIGGYLIWKLKN